MRIRSGAVALAVLSLACSLTPSQTAHAFCGFYVSGAGADLYNNATVVVLMRDGTRTVLTMQNNYEGPTEDFALVIPVPVILQRENVKVVPREIFARIDALAAPRLVEYWEQDPCMVEPEYEVMYSATPTSAVAEESAVDDSAQRHGVRIEARFEVGEYDVLILSAQQANGLESFLTENHYRIPAGAADVLRPYVAGGMKFFVAKVDVDRVHREGGHVMLSPLRFHYDSEDFSLPVRLGLLNSSGAQDLLVHILARGVRYEAANYPNVAIPTNLVVTTGVKQEFGPFYASLFDRLLEQHPRAVVTEYAWDAGWCDPCPTEPLNGDELATLGADVLPSFQQQIAAGEVDYSFTSSFTLTRLHARYTRESLGEDLVFRPAPSIRGGQGVPDAEGHVEQGAQSAEGANNTFQGRYLILHRWEGALTCESPRRGNWGGPWPTVSETPANASLTNAAFVQRGANLQGFLAQDATELGAAGVAMPEGPIDAPRPLPPTGGCASCSAGAPGGGALAGALAAVCLAGGVLWRRRRVG